MKRLLFFFIVLITGIINLSVIHADETNSEEGNGGKNSGYRTVYVRDDKGLLLSAGGGLDYYSAGLGFYFEEYHGGMFGQSLNTSGVMAEYKSKTELHVRAFQNYSDGDGGGGYLGIAATAALDFDKAIVTGGLSPELGFRTPYFALFFRYNFYFYKWEQYNCPELVLHFYITRNVPIEIY